MSNKQITLFEGDVKIISSIEPSVYGYGNLDIAGDLIVTGTATITTVTTPHSGLTGLTSGDDHTQYVLLAGRSGGQTVTAGTASGNNLILRSTSNATKGSVVIDETTASTSNSTGSLRLSGSIGISNTTDAISSTNGGTFTTAGGLAVAKKAYIGTDLSVLGTATITALTAPHGGLTGISNDDHTQYVLLAGRSGGQTLTAGTASGNNLILRSTSNATKGSIVLDETTASTSNSTGSLLLSGGIGISNTIDATSSTNGGTFTTAGGLAVAKKAYIGTDLSVLGTATITALTAPHGGLTGMSNDDHTQYALLAGRSGGQTLTAGTASGNNLILRSTSNATKGSIVLDETTASTSNSTGSLLLSGGIGISNTTDAISSTNGGTFTTAGGLAVAKKAYIGTDLSVLGTATITALTAPHGGLTGMSNDDHIQYALLAGRSGGQTLTAGTSANNNLILRSTSNATKGSIVLDETTTSTSNSTGSLLLSGGIGISNTTDATSSTNGGTFTTAGGLAVAKKVYIGTDLNVIGGGIFNTYIQTINISTPSNPASGNIRFYTDTSDSLLKSLNSSGTLTTYQPTTTKGDLLTHNGTTQIRLPTAANSKFLTTNSSTSSGLEWVDVTVATVGGTLFNYYIIRHQLSTGTHGGTNVINAWTTSVLNSITEFPVSTTDVTLSSNVMTFTAGSYFIQCIKLLYKTDGSCIRLFNSSTSSVIQSGISTFVHETTHAFVNTTVTFTSTTNVILQYYTLRAESTDGLGRASGIPSTSEIYTNIMILKIA